RSSRATRRATSTAPLSAPTPASPQADRARLRATLDGSRDVAEVAELAHRRPVTLVADRRIELHEPERIVGVVLAGVQRRVRSPDDGDAADAVHRPRPARVVERRAGALGELLEQPEIGARVGDAGEDQRTLAVRAGLDIVGREHLRA